jgi:hypothetical protein
MFALATWFASGFQDRFSFDALYLAVATEVACLVASFEIISCDFAQHHMMLSATSPPRSHQRRDMHYKNVGSSANMEIAQKFRPPYAAAAGAADCRGVVQSS